jgi:transposase
VAGLSVERIHQDLRIGHGFKGSYDSVWRYVQKLGLGEAERVWRMECEPGEEVQVDYGTMYLLETETGRPRKVHLLLMTLSHSRKCYVEAVLRQTTESFIRSLENGFRYFGGVARRLCLDNLAAAVKQADWFDPELNPKIVSFARFYGVVIMPTRPYRPTDKGKVESGVKYVKNNALKGRRFASLEAINEHLRWWMSQVADLRIHGTTKQQVRAHFLASEKTALKALPDGLFPCYQEARRSVHRDSYVEVARSYYEVPAEHVGKQVWVRWDAKMVRVHDEHMRQIAAHVRLEPGQHSHVLGVGGCRGSVADSLLYYRSRVGKLGRAIAAWADGCIAENPDRAVRRLQGLLHLWNRHRAEEVETAARKACLHGQYSLRQLRLWLDTPQDQEVFAFLQHHELIREPEIYGELTGTSDLFDN